MNNHAALLRMFFSILKFSHQEGTKGTKKTRTEFHSLRNGLGGFLFIVGLISQGVVLAQSNDSAHLSLSGSVDVYYVGLTAGISFHASLFRQHRRLTPCPI